MVTDDLRRLYASTDGIGLAELVRRRETTPGEIVEVAIDAIERVNPRINAVIHKAYDAARTAEVLDGYKNQIFFAAGEAGDEPKDEPPPDAPSDDPNQPASTVPATTMGQLT